MALGGRLSTKALTGHLKQLAGEAVDITPDGTPITAEQKLAQLIWKQALGWTEEYRDESGNLKKVVHPPVAWCQQFLYERIDGKAPVAQADVSDGLKAVDKVRDLAKQRLNNLATAGSAPTHKPKGSNGSGSGSGTGPRPTGPAGT